MHFNLANLRIWISIYQFFLPPVNRMSGWVKIFVIIYIRSRFLTLNTKTWPDKSSIPLKNEVLYLRILIGTKLKFDFHLRKSRYYGALNGIPGKIVNLGIEPRHTYIQYIRMNSQNLTPQSCTCLAIPCQLNLPLRGWAPMLYALLVTLR